MLAGGSELKTTTSTDGLIINVPEKATDSIATVVKVVVNGGVSGGVANPNGKMKTGALD